MDTKSTIMHRDIKPENILVQCQDVGAIHVKLADFGLTRASRDLTTICGSPRYLAPEVYNES
jgi:serine/threonine protein kinase